MATLTLRITGDGIPRFTDAVEALGSKQKAHNAYRRAINRVNDKAFTQVRRTLAKQVGLTQAKTVELGNLDKDRANFTSLQASIKSAGGYVSLKEFGAKQFGYGTRAKPWGQSHRFPSSFIFVTFPPRSGPLRTGIFHL